MARGYNRKELVDFRYKAVYNEVESLDDIGFDKIRDLVSEKGLLTRFQMRVVLSEKYCHQMLTFLQMIVGKDDYFERLLDILTEIGEQELCDKIWQYYVNCLVKDP